MLARLLFVAALLVAALLVACDSAAPDRPDPDPATAYAAVYFWHDHGLVPEFRALDEVDPERRLFSYLARPPLAPGLTTRMPPGTELLQAAEAGEGHLLIEPSPEFWGGPARAVFERVAQVVQTMGVLEEGRRITLLRGPAPARIRRPGGEVVDQPITRDDLDPPLIRVGQPVGGAFVGRQIPISVDLARPQPLRVTVRAAGETLAARTLSGERGTLRLGGGFSGEAAVVIELRRDRIAVRVPVRVA